MTKYILLLTILLFNCKQTSSQEQFKTYNLDPYSVNKIKNYIEENLTDENYKLENYIEKIDYQEFLNDSLNYKNNMTYFYNSHHIKTNYGKVILKNIPSEGDSFVEYSNLKYSQMINSYIINLTKHESSSSIILNKDEYKYFEIAGDPHFSQNNNYVASFKDEESNHGIIEIYKVKKGELINILNLWSEVIIPQNIFWDKNSNIVLKSYNNNTLKTEYYKIAYKNITDFFLTNTNTYITNHWKGAYSVCVDDIRADTINSVSCYEFTIQENEAFLERNTMQCVGKYSINKQEKELNLFYADVDNNCRSSYPSFIIKKENNNYYIKGVKNNKGEINDWINIKKE